MDDKDLRFVAKHYRRGAFSADKAWRRLSIVFSSWWSRSRIAAAVAAVVVLGATAAIVIRQYEPSPKQEIAVTEQPSFETRAAAVKVIEFDNASLTVVAEEIKKVYDIEITGLPADADSVRLSLRYEGNVRGLIENINDILDTDLSIKE